jgi:uncharacterized protein YjiS (DUF1127 family)
MSTQTHRRQATSHALTQTFPATRASLAEFILEALTTLGGNIERAVRRRRDLRQLAEMDDHLLHDIGISRSEIEHAVRYGRR